LEQGDVLCGIGCKTAEIPRVEAQSVHVHALRGPISYDVFKAAGYDVSQVRFLADPGLLIGKMVPARKPIRGRVVFIPHYRDRKLVWNRMPKDIRAVDIDNLPSRLAREIQKAECVYSSSLHGLIFAHALGRPCVFVRPMTEEPLLKYEDYFLSVGLKMPVPLESIANVDLASAPTSPAVLSIDPSQISFPSEMLLSARGIIQ
jgi:hypothetical protein